MFKLFLKKYFVIIIFALIINIPIIILGAVRTNKEITLPGDTANINNLISIDKEYKEDGTFSSIYVVSFEHSTILQNIITSSNDKIDVEDINLEYNQLSDFELYDAGQIQKRSSIEKAMILSYEKAKSVDSNINIDYEYQGLQITYYSKNSKLKIKDIIIKINDIDISVGYSDFRTSLVTELYDNDNLDKITILRNNKEIILTEEEIDYYNFSCYDIFDINYDTLSPKAKINKSNSGGPSGGLLQALSIYNKLTLFDYSKGLKISGTGTINLSGKVGKIGGIKQKIYTAFNDNVDVFFCPSENYDEALIAYNKINNKEKMALVKVYTLDDALGYLEALNV